MKAESENKVGAIVLGGHVQGLGIVRILGRKGIHVIVIDNTDVNLAKHSKYCESFFRVKDEMLLDFFYSLEQCKKYRGWVIFPTNDFHVKLLSKNKLNLENHFIVGTDSWNSVSIFHNKVKTYKLVLDLGIPIAKTYFPESEAELDTLQIEFPCIIKPAIMYSFYKQVKKKVLVCKNRLELKTNYKKVLEFIPYNEVIVQEIIKGSGKNQYSACFLFLDGQTFIHLTACRLRQHPLDFGNATTYAETIDLPVLKEYGETILKKAEFNGICEVEFKLDDRDNQYKFLEVNTRSWKWHSIANKAETPFISNYFNFLKGKQIHPVKGFRKVAFQHLLTDFPVQLLLLVKGSHNWNHKIKPLENAVWARDDIKPWFFEKLYFPYFIVNR